MKHHHQTTPPDGFRLIRAFSVEHNLRRFRRYVERLERQPDVMRRSCRHRLRQRFGTRWNRGRPEGASWPTAPKPRVLGRP